MPSHLSALRRPAIATNAKILRRHMTDAETRLWYHLRACRFLGLKFRRQVPIGDFVADFLCESKHVIVEVDGGQHAEDAEADRRRTRSLEILGYRVVRYWNNEVLGNTTGVLEDLAWIIEKR
jgi:very-short-patch-repair endonuclease